LRPPRTPRPDGTTYTNVGFAFAVDYPRDIFTGYAEPDNSDGATFKTDAPWVEIRAWGSYNVEKKSPRAVSPSATPARIKTRRSIIRRSSATLLSSPASSAAPWDAPGSGSSNVIIMGHARACSRGIQRKSGACGERRLARCGDAAANKPYCRTELNKQSCNDKKLAELIRRNVHTSASK
jgi:hypothetical protein